MIARYVILFLLDISLLVVSRIYIRLFNLKLMKDLQKIRSTAYASLSVFGLCFTIIVGILITLTSYILEPIAAFLHNKTGHSPYAHLEWRTNSTLQLQRLAYEEAQLGTWSRCTDTIPVTEPDEILAGLDTTNLKHPVLQKSRVKEDPWAMA